MLELVAPAQRLHVAWLEAHAEWGAGAHEDGFGVRPADDVGTPAGFGSWLARLAIEADPVRTSAAGRHRCIHRWIVENDRVLGGVVLRVGNDDYVSWTGHIGYGIRPSARRRGVATWALRRVLSEARDLRLVRVLAVCAADNMASARTLERCGGIFDAVRDTPLGPARRYWCDLCTD